MTEEVTTTPESSAPPVEAPASVTSTPAPVEKPATTTAPAAAPTEVKTEPKARVDTIREAMIKAGRIKPAQVSGERPRDAQGKFLPVQGEVKAAPQVTQTPAPAPQVQTVPLPRSLKKELEAHWKSVHPELQKAYLQRDADYDRGIAQYRSRAEAGEAILKDIQQYDNIFKQTGTDARQTIKNLMPIAAVLATGSPQQKATVILQAAQQYGVSLEQIAQVAQGGGQSHPMMDPQYQALAQQVMQLKQYIEGNQQKSAESENARISAMASAFGKDKEHFENLRPQMWSLLQAQATAESQGLNGPLGSPSDTALWSESQWIENAYNAALRLDPNLYQAELQRQRDEALRLEREKANQVAQTSRAASVQVRGAPGGPANPAQVDKRDRRAVIASALRSHAS